LKKSLYLAQVSSGEGKNKFYTMTIKNMGEATTCWRTLQNKIYNFNCLLNIIIMVTSPRMMRWMDVSTYRIKCIQSFSTAWE
jgi:hypothetical protein